MTMRVAITGTSGFVGSHVLEALIVRGVEVTVGTFHTALSIRNESIRVVQLDVHQPPDNLFEKLGAPDVLLHLAWSGLPNYGSSRHVDDELPAQQLFLNACASSGIPRIVVAGTCAEYGLASGEVSESSPLRPVTCYGEAKARLFRYMLNLRDKKGFKLAWARLFYLYGQGQSPHSIYSQLQSAIRRGDPSFDMSGGEQVRDYLPIEEAARLLVTVALDGGDAGPVNICSGSPVALKALVARWVAASNSSIELNLGRFPYSSSEPMAFWGSRRKLNQILEVPSA